MLRIHLFLKKRNDKRFSKKSEGRGGGGSSLIPLSVFIFVFIVEHAKVGVVSAFADKLILYGLAYCTTGLVSVRTIVVAAVNRMVKNLLKVVTDLLFFHIEGTESLDAGCVDDVSVVFGQWEHFREGSRVHTLVVCRGYFSGLYVQVGH